MHKIFLVIPFLFISQFSYAEEKKSDTLPFLVEKPTYYQYKYTLPETYGMNHAEDYENKNYFFNESFTREIKNVPVNDIKQKIQSINDTLCSVNKNGSYEVWLSTDVGGSFGISASVKSGIKAIINCNK